MSAANESMISQKTTMENNPEFNFSDPKTAHDHVIIVVGVNFYVNSGILSVWSEMFRNKFKNEPIETKRPLIEAGNTLLSVNSWRTLFKPKDKAIKKEDVKEIKLTGMTAKDFKNFLMLVYPLEFKVTADNYKGLIDLAFRFLAPAVLQKCKKFIDKDFEKLDAFELLELTIKYDMEDIKDKVENFFKTDANILKCSTGGHVFVHHIFCSECHKDKKTYLEQNRTRIGDLSLQAKACVLHIICNI